MPRVSYRKIRELSIAETAYLAGLIDGEGTITLTYKHKGEQRQLAVTISSTEYQLLEWVLKRTGIGKLTKKTPRSSRHSLSYVYTANNQQALDLLEKVSPYLITYKRERAKLVIKDYKRLTPRNGKYSPGLLGKREKFITKFFEIEALVKT